MITKGPNSVQCSLELAIKDIHLFTIYKCSWTTIDRFNKLVVIDRSTLNPCCAFYSLCSMIDLSFIFMPRSNKTRRISKTSLFTFFLEKKYIDLLFGSFQWAQEGLNRQIDPDTFLMRHMTSFNSQSVRTKNKTVLLRFERYSFHITKWTCIVLLDPLVISRDQRENRPSGSTIFYFIYFFESIFLRPFPSDDKILLLKVCEKTK